MIVNCLKIGHIKIHKLSCSFEHLTEVWWYCWNGLAFVQKYVNCGLSERLLAVHVDRLTVDVVVDSSSSIDSNNLLSIFPSTKTYLRLLEATPFFIQEISFYIVFVASNDEKVTTFII